MSKQLSIRRGAFTDLDRLEQLWASLHDHHATVLPQLGDRKPRTAPDSWAVRRAKYERWLASPDAFLLVATDGEAPIGYAFVTIESEYACWQTGRVAELQTLSVLPEWRDAGVGSQLLEAVWAELGERGVSDLSITTVATNLDSHRFYERHGFEQSFVVYHGHR